jgi:hypothetical protein
MCLREWNEVKSRKSGFLKKIFANLVGNREKLECNFLPESLHYHQVIWNDGLIDSSDEFNLRWK